LAIKKLYLGDVDRDGTKDITNGWRHYGFNLDGKVSDANSTDLCKPVASGQKSKVYTDGDNGLDNSFGENILPILLGLAPNASTQVNDSIAAGHFTLMLQIQKLGSGTDYNPLLTQLYGGANLMASPKWDGTDKWPVIPELLASPTDITTSKIQFPASYVV